MGRVEKNPMNHFLDIPNLESSSMPSFFNQGTGTGSLVASMLAQGIIVSKFTPEGTIRPFGQDNGTADDCTIHY